MENMHYGASYLADFGKLIAGEETIQRVAGMGVLFEGDLGSALEGENPTIRRSLKRGGAGGVEIYSHSGLVYLDEPTGDRVKDIMGRSVLVAVYHHSEVGKEDVIFAYSYADISGASDEEVWMGLDTIVGRGGFADAGWNRAEVRKGLEDVGVFRNAASIEREVGKRVTSPTDLTAIEIGTQYGESFRIGADLQIARQ